MGVPAVWCASGHPPVSNPVEFRIYTGRCVRRHHSRAVDARDVVPISYSLPVIVLPSARTEILRGLWNAHRARRFFSNGVLGPVQQF